MKRILSFAIPLLLFPLLLLLGVMLGSQSYPLISAAACLLTLLLFYTGVENRKIGARRLVITAILTALSTLGRLIPLFKPITAVTLLGAAYLGPESGFLIGSLSALLSNFAFGQGPWTPFQMLAWGLIGYFAGRMGRALRKHKWLLLLTGLLSALAYSLVMDLYTVLFGMAGGGMTGDGLLAAYLAAILTALPHTVTYALSNLVFLLLLSDPMGKALTRTRTKYGI